MAKFGNMYDDHKFCRRCEKWFMRDEVELMCPDCNSMLRVSPLKSKHKIANKVFY